MTTLDVETESLENLAAAMRDGGVSASGLADWAVANHDRRTETLQAYKAWEPSRFHAEAAAADAALAAGIDLGPLQGIPVSVKDLYGLSGYPIFAGCSRELPEKWQAEGPVVRALRHQLATVSGKTHTVQFAFGALGTNPYWGTPRNPWDGENHRVPGGSSAGAGVSLIEGSALLAYGSDTGGSVRMPASFTGTVGVKTSKGRWSTAGIVPLSTTLDTAGTLTRTVADAALAFAVIDPQTTEPADAFCRRLGTASLADFHIGVCDWYFADCDPGVHARRFGGAPVEAVELRRHRRSGSFALEPCELGLRRLELREGRHLQRPRETLACSFRIALACECQCHAVANRR